MKKLIAVMVVMVMTLGMGLVCYAADNVATSQEQTKNINVGATNPSAGWVEVIDNTGIEAAKGKNPGDHVTGVIAGGTVGAAKTIHRLGAGVIDLATFWIPKKQPLINPEKARLK